MKNYNQILIACLEGIENWTDLKSKLEQYNTSQTTTTVKKTTAGNIFEYFAKYYFLNDPKQTELFKEVWLYSEIPLEILERLKLPPVDHGIDLLLQDYDNDFHAVQCKFKNDEFKKLSWSGDKIANVFALATLCQKVIVFTNVSDVTSVAKNFESKYSQIAYDELLKIEKDVFNNILLSAKGQQSKPLVKFTPKEHQEIAISKVSKHLENNERGQLILPCGAGKTLTALWIKEELKYSTTLVLLPSLALLKQIKNDWARHKNEPYIYMCVCSEKDIDKDRTDSIIVHTYEIGGPVTTDPNIAAQFLQRAGNKVVFSTYQSLKVIRDSCAQLSNFSFDLTICDEAHRTAGSKNKNVYTLVHNNNKIPSRKRLYMTATPKVVSTKLKTKLGEDYELLCDMSNPEVFGDEAFRMTFGEAIDKEILVDYKIIGIGVSDKQVKKFIEERNYLGDITITDLAHNFSLNLVMDKYKAFHGLTFHSRVKLAENFAERHREFFLDTFSKHVEGKQSTTYRSKVLHDFKESQKGIVSNARCLTEGVDVPTIDLIYFCDPKTSKIDIVQAAGRALRTDSTGMKKMGFIVVPIFHHIEENLEAEIKRKPIFNHLIQVIRSLCDQDERLQAEINEIAYQKGKKNNSKIEIDFSEGETEAIIKFEGLEKKLRNVLFDEIIEKTRVFWDVMFKKLHEFIEQNGHMNISRNDEEQLCNWIYEQRRQNRSRKLNSLKKKKLDEIGFDWKSEEFLDETNRDEIWWSSYVKLLDYFKENGDSDIPARYKKDKPLGTWAVAQRAKRRKNELSQDRIDLLDEIDFSWDPKVKIFEQFCKRLVEFKEKYGHTEVPILGDEFPKLGRWTNKYRVILNNGKLNANGSVTHNGSTLTKPQIEKLNELGFKKAVRKVHWEDNYNDLKEYYLKTGHSRPSQPESGNLYYWCYKTRKHQDQLTREQRKLLEDIEFDFSYEHKYSRSGSNRNWSERFTELQLFFEENQNFNITLNNEVFDGLYKWLVYQRRQYNKKNLSAERIAMLRSIGFNFDVHFQPHNDIDWEERYRQLKEYYAINKTFFIPTNDENCKGLLSWLRYQRKLYRDEKLDEEKKIKLLELGYSFNKTYRGENKRSNIKHEAIWNEKFDQLKTYYSKYNTFLIQRTNEEYKHLIPWIQYQRNQFRNNKLEEEKISKLSAIGFSFDLNYRGKKFQLEIDPETNSVVVNNSYDQQWQNNFEKLKDYFEEFGTFLIPGSKPEFLPLRAWLQYQKQLFRKNKLDSEKINKLEGIGFSFNMDFRGQKSSTALESNDNWNEMFEELKFYNSEYKTFLIPKQLTQYYSLKIWLQEQKRLFKSGRLSDSKLNRFSQIGYSFDLNYRGRKFKYEVNPELKEKKSKKEPKPDSWEMNYLKLLEYKIHYGNCNVSRSFEDKSLASFVSRQRFNYRKKKLSENQIQKLELLGFNWEVTRSSNSKAWDSKFSELKQFYEKNGHSQYKKSNGNESLYNWILYQRMEKKKGKLSEFRINALNSIKFLWGGSDENLGSKPDDDKWLNMLERLENYKKENGNCLVPQIYEKDKSLGRWVNDQRTNNKKGTLSDYRKELLDDLGFIWDKKEYEWDQKFELLKQFYQKNGHFDIKQNEKDFEGLYHWFYKIRKEGTTEEKKQRLKGIGYEFVEYDPENWFEYFSKVAKLKEISGDFNFKESEIEKETIKWIDSQKILIERSELPKDKVEILAAIGIQKEGKPIRIKNSLDWYQMLDQLKTFNSIHGHFNVPKKFPENQSLANWLYYQKTLKRTGKLESEKIEAIEKIGFKFPIPMNNQKTWDERFEELVKYKNEFGDCKVPVRYKENQQLATWVRTQRRNYKEETIKKEKKDKLDNIGFIWRVTE